AKADVVVFSPERVADPATYEDPHRYARGVSHVVVNGGGALKDGEHTGLPRGRGLSPPPASDRAGGPRHPSGGTPDSVTPRRSGIAPSLNPQALRPHLNMWHQACFAFRGNQPDTKGLFMTRVLMIDSNRKLTESVGRQCLDRRIAIRMTDTFCEGV